MIVWMLALHTSAALAQKRRTTVHFDCADAGCKPREPVPPKATIDIVVAGAAAQPIIRAGGTVVAVKLCVDPTTWCAANVATEDLQVSADTLRAIREQARTTYSEGISDASRPTRALRFEHKGGVIELVGPDVREAPATQPAIAASGTPASGPPAAGTPATAAVAAAPERDDLDEAFADVVLVGHDRGFACSGVLITPRHVLTAAHCLPATRVAFGNAMDDAAPVAVAGARKHPTADLAVVEISARALVPVRPRRRDASLAAPAGTIRILGFGVTDPLRLTGFGRKRMLTLSIDGWGCDQRRAAELGCLPGRELLLRGGRGNDTCLGDSGGPLFEDTPQGWRLVAITSRGTRPKKVLCGEGGIYTRVDVVGAWLEEVTK